MTYGDFADFARLCRGKRMLFATSQAHFRTVLFQTLCVVRKNCSNSALLRPPGCSAPGDTVANLTESLVACLLVGQPNGMLGQYSGRSSDRDESVESPGPLSARQRRRHASSTQSKGR